MGGFLTDAQITESRTCQACGEESDDIENGMCESCTWESLHPEPSPQ